MGKRPEKDEVTRAVDWWMWFMLGLAIFIALVFAGNTSALDEVDYSDAREFIIVTYNTQTGEVSVNSPSMFLDSWNGLPTTKSELATLLIISLPKEAVLVDYMNVLGVMGFKLESTTYVFTSTAGKLVLIFSAPLSIPETVKSSA